MYHGDEKGQIRVSRNFVGDVMELEVIDVGQGLGKMCHKSKEAIEHLSKI